MTPIADTLRALMLDTPVGNTWILALAWCAAGIVVGRAAAAYLFRRR